MITVFNMNGIIELLVGGTMIGILIVAMIVMRIQDYIEKSKQKPIKEIVEEDKSGLIVIVLMIIIIIITQYIKR